jgi:hypothetical protein
MRTLLPTVFVFVTVLTPVTRADDKDKGRFGLGLNKLNPFRKKDETDAKHVPEVLPVMVASLKQDPSAAVRATVAESIGKLKPVSPNAGVVLEAAAANDPNEGVRKAAQNSLWAYQANGYRPQNVTAVVPTAEPPKAAPKRMSPAATTKQITSSAPAASTPLGVPSGVNRGPTFGETGEPPLAKSRPAVKPPVPSIPVPPMPAESPRAVPPSGTIPAPLPLPPAPTLPQTMPAARPGTAPTIPTPPPSGNPGF